MANRRTLTRMTGILSAHDVPAKSKAFDLLFAGALTLFFGAISVTQEGFGGILGLLMLGPLIWRRTHPELVFFGVSAVAVLQWLIGTHLQGGNVGLLVALYAISVYGEVRYSRIALAVGGMGVLFQQAEHLAHLGQRGPAGVADGGECLLGLLGRRVRGVQASVGLDDHDRQPVRDHVVDLAGDPGPLVRDGQLGLAIAVPFELGRAFFELLHVQASGPAAFADRPDPEDDRSQ